MAIAFACQGCGANLSVSDAAAGRTGKCPHCRSPITVPAASVPVAAAVPHAVMPAMALPAAPVLAEVVPQGAGFGNLAVPDLRLRRSRRWVYAGAAGALGLVVLFLTVVFSSGKSDAPALRYLPDNFQFYLVGSYEGVASSPAYKEMERFSREFAKLAPPMAQSDPDLMEKIGNKPDNIRRMTAGMAIGSGDVPLPDMVMVIETAKPLNLDEVKANLKKLNFAESTVGGHKVYLGNQGFMSVSYCPIDNRTVLMGMNNSLGEVLKRDRPAQVTSNMRAVMKRCNSSRMAFAAGLSFPDLLSRPDMRQGMQMMGAPGAKFVNDLDALIMEMDISTDFEMNLVLTCKSKDTAEELTKMVNGGLAMAKLAKGPDVPDEFFEMLEAVKLKQSGYDLVASLKLKPALLTKLMEKAIQEARLR